MSAFVLKLIAVISMLFDHSGYLIFGQSSFFNYIGRLAFPIFAFQVAEGYTHTKNLKKYILRLSIFALISQIPYTIFYKVVFNDFGMNVMFTLLFGLITISIFDQINQKFVGLASLFLFSLLAQFLKLDYGAYGVVIIFLFYVFKDNAVLKFTSFILATFIRYFAELLPYGILTTLNTLSTINPISIYALCTISSIMPIILYNGKKGRDMKYFLYLFYPIHLLIISILYIILR